MKNYYQILGLPEGASKEDIKKQYRKLSKEYHPDHNPDAQEKFIAIKEAYDYLMQDETEITMPFFIQSFAVHITLEEAYNGCSKVVQFTRFFSNSDGNAYTKVVSETVNIPAGTREGSKIRLTPNVVAVIKYLPHPVFSFRHGSLIYDLYIDIPTAVLGGEVIIPTLDSSIKLKLPECNQNSEMFRCAGKGIGGSDLYVCLHINMPKSLSDKERKYYKKLQKLND